MSSASGWRSRSSGLGFGSLAVAAGNRVIVGLLVLAFAAWELWDVAQKATAWLIGEQTGADDAPVSVAPAAYEDLTPSDTGRSVRTAQRRCLIAGRGCSREPCS
jgi:hypothetical protein